MSDDEQELISEKVSGSSVKETRREFLSRLRGVFSIDNEGQGQSSDQVTEEWGQAKMTRREFLQRSGEKGAEFSLILATIGLERYSRYTRKTGKEDLTFEITMDYPEGLTEFNVLQKTVEELRQEYTRVENWEAEGWEKMMGDVERVRDSAIWVGEQLRGGEITDDIKKVVDRMVGLRDLVEGPSGKDDSTGLLFDPDPEQLGVIARNNIKVEAFLTLSSLFRRHPDKLSGLDEELEKFDFSGNVGYQRDLRNFGYFAVGLLSRAEFSEWLERDRAGFGHEADVVGGWVNFFDWDREKGFYWETEEEGQKVVLASYDPNGKELADGELEYVDGGVKYKVGKRFFDEAHELRVESMMETVKDYWGDITRTSQRYGIDPMLLGAIIMAEQAEVFRYDQEAGEAPLGQYQLRMQKELANLPDWVGRLLEEIRPVITEDDSDLWGALLGKNTSVGVAQIKIEVAKREGLVELFGRTLNENTPNWLMGLMLSIPEVSIDAAGRYLRNVINTLNELQSRGDNWYLYYADDVFGGFYDWRKSEGETMVNGSFPVSDKYVPNRFNPVSAMGRWFTSPPYGTFPDEMYEGLGEEFARFPTVFKSDWGKNVEILYKYLLARADDLGESALRRRDEVVGRLEE